MVYNYKLIDILYFLSSLLLAMVNYILADETKSKDETNSIRKDIRWVSLHIDSNEWGWVDDQI
jgi:hypothetical protein